MPSKLQDLQQGFDSLSNVYPATDHTSEALAEHEYRDAINGGADPAAIVDAARAFRHQRDCAVAREGEDQRRYTPGLQRWLRERRWKRKEQIRTIDQHGNALSEVVNGMVLSRTTAPNPLLAKCLANQQALKGSFA